MHYHHTWLLLFYFVLQVVVDLYSTVCIIML